MLRTVEAMIEPDGSVRLLEPLEITTTRRALVTLLEEAGAEPESNITALLSEPALAEWNTEEEDAAWAHLQQER